MNESALARSTLDKLMQRRLEALPGYHESMDAHALWFKQDIRNHPEAYTPHMTKACEVYPQIISMWQTLIEDSDPVEEDTCTAAWRVFGEILLYIAEQREPPEVKTPVEQFRQQLAAYPEIQSWLDRRRARANDRPPEPVEVDYVHAHYPARTGSDGKIIVLLNDDPAGVVLCRRVYTHPDTVIIHSVRRQDYAR